MSTTKTFHHGQKLGLAVAITVLAGSTVPALAQTQLPGIVIQGGTLTPPPARRPATPAPQPESGSGDSSSSSQSDGPGNSEATAATSVGDTSGGTGSGGGAASAGHASESIGSAVSVVSGEELRQQQVRNAAEALRALPGVSVSRGGGFSAQTQVRIRGAEANHTLVIIDGVVANDTNNGAFDLSDLSAENIERIEVIRGPQSGLYGSNALGGVVNIVTRDGRGPLKLTLRSEGGSFGTFDYAARLSGGNDKAWGSLTYTERHATGFNISPIGIENDGGLLRTAIAKGGVRVAPGLVLDFNVRYSDKRGDRDTEGGPAGTLAVQVDDPSTFANTVWLGGANLRWDTLEGRLTHVLRVSRNETRTSDISPTFLSNNISETVRYGYLGTWRHDTPALMHTSHALTLLVEQEQEAFTPRSDFADGLTRDRGRLATALEYKGDIAKRLFLTGNIRHDDNDIFRDYNTWRLATSLKLSEVGLRPHASIGTGVKLPTMFETFGSIPGSFTPNPNLQPEESKGWDAGVEWTVWSGRAILDVTYFQQNLTNKIDGFAPGPRFSFTAVNQLGESHREGVELSARLELARNLTLTSAYTHLTALDANGLDEIRRPRHSARADLTYLFGNGRGTATLSALYNGEMRDTAFFINSYAFGFPSTTAVRTTLDEYWLVNAAASYKVTPGIELFGRVENLLNEKYYEIHGFGTAGIAGFAGVKLTFGGEGEPALQRR